MTGSYSDKITPAPPLLTFLHGAFLTTTEQRFHGMVQIAQHGKQTVNFPCTDFRSVEVHHGLASWPDEEWWIYAAKFPVESGPHHVEMDGRPVGRQQDYDDIRDIAPIE